MERNLLVSVIIPVFNDAERLRLCLEALAQQTYKKNCYEIIVVDNGSDEDQQIASVVNNYPQTTYAHEQQTGSYAARNRGITLAKGKVLAFTDADCIPSPDWIEKGVAHLISIPNCGLVAGKVNLFFRGEKANPVELYESVTAFPQQRLLDQQHGAATANVFTFKAVMDAVGPFNACLRSNGDIEWGQRVFASGYEQFYASDTCVAHPARCTLKALRRRTLRLAGGVFFRFIQPEQGFVQRNLTFARLLLDDLMPPVNFMISALTDKRLHSFRQKAVVTFMLCWVRYISAFEKVRLKFGGVPNRG